MCYSTCKWPIKSKYISIYKTLADKIHEFHSLHGSECEYYKYLFCTHCRVFAKLFYCITCINVFTRYHVKKVTIKYINSIHLHPSYYLLLFLFLKNFYDKTVLSILKRWFLMAMHPIIKEPVSMKLSSFKNKRTRGLVYCKTILNPTEKFKRTKPGTHIHKSMFALNFKCQTNSVSVWDGMLHNHNVIILIIFQKLSLLKNTRTDRRCKYFYCSQNNHAI